MLQSGMKKEYHCIKQTPSSWRNNRELIYVSLISPAQSTELWRLEFAECVKLRGSLSHALLHTLFPSKSNECCVRETVESRGWIKSWMFLKKDSLSLDRGIIRILFIYMYTHTHTYIYIYIYIYIYKVYTLNKIINAILLFLPPFSTSWTQRSKTFSILHKRPVSLKYGSGSKNQSVSGVTTILPSALYSENRDSSVKRTPLQSARRHRMWAFAHSSRLRRLTAVRSRPRWGRWECRWASLRQFLTVCAEILWLCKPIVAAAVRVTGLRWSWRWRCWMWRSWAGVVTCGLRLWSRLDVLPNSLKHLW